MCAIATQNIISNVIKKNNIPEGVLNLVSDCGDKMLGKKIASDKRISLVSATGSTRMGKSVAEVVGARLGKTLLELGGNNAMIISENADLNIAKINLSYSCRHCRPKVYFNKKINNSSKYL